MITADRSFKAGNPRFDLQAGAVDRLEALYWGPGAWWPHQYLDVGRQDIDVVSVQDPFWRGLVGLVLARRFKARFNVQVHADLEAQNFLKRLIARFVLLRADSIRVVSEHLKKQLRNYGPRRSIVTVLPVFVDVRRFKNVQRALDERPMVLWAGRFEDEKDPLRALAVFRKVREKGIDATLVMLGAGSLEQKLRVKARDLPVEFPGWHDTAPYLARAHVVLSTSRAESWGASIVEALAAGVPVVAPDVGIAREAGATVVSREQLADAVVEAIRTRAQGALKLNLPSREAWVTAWQKTLL